MARASPSDTEREDRSRGRIQVIIARAGRPTAHRVSTPDCAAKEPRWVAIAWRV